MSHPSTATVRFCLRALIVLLLAHSPLLRAQLVPAGSTWKYLTGGSDPGANWTRLNYLETGWNAGGPAPLGANSEGGIRTSIDIGPSGNVYPAVFFRKTFVVTNPAAIGSLTARLMRDDGAVVYLNGNVIVRDRVVEGTPLLGYLNAGAVGGADETNFFSQPPIAVTNLVAGTNILAAEVHQDVAGSSDLVFDFELIGNIAPQVTMTSPANGQSFAAPVSITLAANAVDPDGSIAKVEFYQNGEQIGEDASSPYSIIWSGAGEGSYQLTAIAFDNNGASVTSAPVAITVSDPSPPRISSVFATTNSVTVSFSKRVVQPSATTIGNYGINNGVTVNSAQYGQSPNSNTIILGTSLLLPSTTYTLTVNNVRDSINQSIATDSQTNFTVLSFSQTTIGNVQPATTVTPVAGGFDITAGGTNIGGASDQFAFNYQQVTGDFDYKVRLASVSLADTWSQAGLMARDTLAANSPFAASVATPSAAGAYFSSRATVGAAAVNAGGFGVNYPNTWLRLRRVGSTFTGYASLDGSLWVQLSSAAINMQSTIYIGMSVSSRTNGVATTAQFRDFQPVVGGTIGGFVSDVEPAGPSSRRTPIAITEIMYNPPPNPSSNILEYIEIYNSNPYFEDIGGYRISGDIDFRFPANTTLKGGEYIVLARNPAHLQATYNIAARVMGPYTNSLPGTGTIRLRNKEDAILLEVNYSSQPPWPAAADGAGHSLVLARPSYGEGSVKAWGISDKVGGSPGTYDGLSYAPQRSVVINEFFANSELPDEDFIELYNHSNAEVNITGCSLSDDPHTNKYVFTATTKIAPRGYVVVYQSQLGFGLSSGGETIYFRNADGSRVLDSIRFEAQANGISSGRYPAGAPEIYPLVARTPGTANSAILIRDIVINELMYKPISDKNEDEYVELYNKSANAVNVGGWRFTSGIDFKIPSNTVIAAKGYLVVAKNAAKLLTNYPNLTTNNTLGNYDGSLGNSGDRVALAMPDVSISTNAVGEVETNRVYVVVDEVTYGAGGSWDKWANEGGSSLELIDPNANHRLGYNWADSDETAKAPWSTVEATGMMDLGSGTANFFELYLQGEGECLVDNVEVIPASSGVNAVAATNSTFESGQGAWAFRGTHIRSTIDDTGGFGGGKCLHLRASTRGDAIHNRCLVPITTPGGIVTLRAKVRWLRGWPEMLLRLHGNYMEAVGLLVLPRNLGTPGAPNSRSVSNAPPAIYAVGHQPVVPAANQSIVVSARVDDPNGIGAVSLFYRIDPSGSYAQLPMNDTGASGDTVAGDGIYSATIPGQAANTLVAFYVQATDAAIPSANVTFPRGASPTTLECLVRFGDPVVPSSFGTYRQWMTAYNFNIWNTRPALSNERLPVAFVYGNFRAIYFAAVKWAGSPYHQFAGAAPNTTGHYSFDLPEDDLFLGTDNLNKVHGPGNSPFDDTTLQREQTGYWFARQLALPWNYRRCVNMYFNGNRPGGANQLMEDTETPGSDVVSSRFPDDPDGNLYKLQPWFEVDDGTTHASALGFANVEWCSLSKYTTVSNGVTVHKLARYRHKFLARAVKGSANEYNDVYALIDAADTPAGSAHTANMLAVAEMEQWMRTFAVHHSVGDWDHFGSQNSQNMYGYRPTEGKWQLMIWDMNILIGNSGSWGQGQNLFVTSGGGANMAKIYDNPTFRRMYLRALKELCNGAFVPANMYPMLDAKYAAYVSSGVNAASPQAIKDWIAAARTSILSTVTAEEAAAFKVTGTNIITTGNNLIVISGEAPMEARTILINGVEWPVTWSSTKVWTIRFPVTAAVNQLQVQAIDVAGNAIAGFSTNLTVNFTGTVASAESSLAINEIMYNPLTPEASFVEIYNNSDFSFDLSGWRMNGLDYTFPAGAIITNRHYLVLTKNRAAFNAAYGASAVAYDQFDGGLDDGGETLSLERPIIVRETNGVTVTTTTIYSWVDRVKYDDDLPWTGQADGFGPSLQLIDANQDNSRVSNWGDSESWRYAVYTGTVAGTNASPGTNFLLFLNTIGEVYIDDINVVLGTQPGVGPNIIVNGDFESPLSGPWTVLGNHSNSVITTSISHSGAACLRAVASGPGSASSALRQYIPPFPSNTVCTLSFYYRPSTNGTNVTLRTNPGSSFNSITAFRPLVFTPGFANSIAVPMAPYDPLWLNELQPNNLTGILDNNGEREPWIELYNSGQSALDLSGYYLTDNYDTNLTKWQFPAGTSLAPGAFKVIWADGQPGQSAGANLHTSFRLNNTTGSVALVRLINNEPQVTDYLTYSGVGPDLSYGAYPNGQAVDRQLFSAVTPGAPNNAREISVFINEWMAGSTNAPGALADPADGDYDDWFELYNAGSTPVDLGGYWLTDNLNSPKGFHIPTNGQYVIPAGGYLLVWADDETGQNTAANIDLHANFQLSRDGEQLGLFAPNGFTQIDGISFGSQTNNISEGRYADGSASRYYMTTPTPRGPNTIGLGNAAPSVNPIGNRIVTLGQTLTLTAAATDPDFPSQALSFSLDAGAPAGASINAASGQFTWTPSPLQAPGTNTVTVRATDNGVPPLSGTRSFVVTVLLPPKAVISSSGGQVSLGFGTLSGKNYQIEYKDSLNQPQWFPLGNPIQANADTLTVPDNLGANPQRFYRIVQLD